jgi:hypothetical protein
MTTYFSGYTDGDVNTTRLYFYISGETISPTFITGYTINDILNDYVGRYVVKFNNSGNNTTLNLFTESINGVDTYYFDDTQTVSYSGGTPPSGQQGYKLYDSQSQPLGGGGNSGLNSELEGGCQQYVTVYKESIIYGTYCVSGATIPYSGLTSANIFTGTTCTGSNIAVGQVIRNVNSNPCGTCGTHSGYSEFRYGLFTIIPAAATGNWGVNFDAITEYARRKLVAKVFCGGIANYKFIDNWLTGSLYMFPFKAKVRWDDEATLDLNVRRTKYCPDLVYFKAGTVENPDKRFYYRSTYFTGTTFSRSSRESLGHPTTIVDLGPRDEFIKEICIDPSLDPNCSVVRDIGPTSYQNFKEMLGLYINYKLDTLDSGDYNSFFKNYGYGGILGTVMNGDILQLISINNEVGIEEFDLQNRNYAAYNPQVLDVEQYSGLLDGGPIPINLVLDDGEGYRVRACLNEPGRLTESSQEVPFYLWDKGGNGTNGFGDGVNHHWDYDNIEVQPLQGMTYNYKYSGDTTHKYLLLPMTKQYSGDTFTYTGVTYNDVNADIESTNLTGYTTYNNQEEGFTYLAIATGTLDNPLTGTLWIRTGETSNWASKAWTNDLDFMVKPTSTNYNGTKQILSTPFLFYFGLRPGKTAIDKLIEKYGPKGAFPSAE